MKKIFKQDFNIIDDSILEGTIDSVIEKLKKIEEEYIAKGYIDITLEWENEYDYQELRIHYSREETDRELEKRKERILKKIKELEEIEDKRKERLNQLKKEYNE